MLFFSRSTTIDKNLSHFLFQAQATISDYLHQHEFTKQFVTDELVWYLVGTNWPSVKTLFSPFFCCTLLFWRGLMYYLSLQAAALLVMPVFVLYTLLVDTFWSVFSFRRIELVLFALIWWHGLTRIDFFCHLILVFLFACSTKKQKKTPRSSNTNHGHRRHKRRHADK